MKHLLRKMISEHLFNFMLNREDGYMTKEDLILLLLIVLSVFTGKILQLLEKPIMPVQLL